MIFACSVELITEKSSRDISVDLNTPARKKECKAIREKIFRERKAAFDMLARY